MRPVRFLVSLLPLVVAAALALPTGASSAPAAAQLKLTPSFGPPTSRLRVSGRGFGASETVDVSFDTTPVATAITNPTGAFIARIRVPATATPGTHTVTATAQSSGLSAQASFLVRTDWPMAGFGPAHLGYNRFENVIGPSNAANLTEAWTLHTGGSVSSAVVVGGLVYAGSNDGYLYALDAATGSQVWAAMSGPWR